MEIRVKAIGESQLKFLYLNSDISLHLMPHAWGLGFKYQPKTDGSFHPKICTYTLIVIKILFIKMVFKFNYIRDLDANSPIRIQRGRERMFKRSRELKLQREVQINTSE